MVNHTYPKIDKANLMKQNSISKQIHNVEKAVANMEQPATG